MEEIRQWAFSICCAAISGGIINMFLPHGNLQKTFKTVFCVFFLSVIIIPFSEAEFKIPKNSNFDAEQNVNIDLSENSFFEAAVKSAEEEIISSVTEIIKENGAEAKDILIKINILPDGSIDITKFILIFEKLNDIDFLKNKIFEKTGAMPEIIVSEEKNIGTD